MIQDKQKLIERTDESILLGTEVFEKIKVKIGEEEIDDRLG